jgi:hypothetical protein
MQLGGAEPTLTKRAMDVTFFYTFSTIAQTLAAAIAFLAAFLLYSLQGINAEIDDHGSRTAGLLRSLGVEEGEVLRLRGQYRELLELAARTRFPETHYQAVEERAKLRTS